MDDLRETVERLCRSSRRAYHNPYDLEWPSAAGRPGWFTSPELVSLHGTPAWDHLDEAAQMELSFWEAVNFYSLNIHGERLLMEGLAARLYRPGLGAATEYLHHMLDEENKHSVWFGQFCLRYAGRIYPDLTVAFPRAYAPGEEDLLFFAQVLIFEQVVDRFNLAMARDERLVPIAGTINERHHDEEVRHLIFGRRIVEDLWWRHSPAWSAETVAGARAQLRAFFEATWRSFYNPRAYRDAGLA
ncbi:MAG: diiron oxygenase, partial [Acidimicrobiales bacterium]